MITDLPDEVLYYIFINFLEFYETVTMRNSNTNFREILDDKFYEKLAFKLYGENFWKLAYKRCPKVSLPYRTLLEELRRIETFQRNYLKTNNKRCANQEFYEFWITVEPELIESYNYIIFKDKKFLK